MMLMEFIWIVLLVTFLSCLVLLFSVIPFILIYDIMSFFSSAILKLISLLHFRSVFHSFVIEFLVKIDVLMVSRALYLKQCRPQG